ncbi:MAG: MBL fold metallo-hydrolase [Candidatus Lambdaproteobacteria bacterium]|nr:MBL fold metallo-hydrolase [Candidatus Lambdaproteobacteria bacterium]
MEELYFRQIQAGPMANFVYLIGSTVTREAAIVDPAWAIDELLTIARSDDMNIGSILITHCHQDHAGGDFMGQHIEGAAELLEHCKAKVYIHKTEAARIPVPLSEIVQTDERSELALGNLRLEFIHTPGHTPGSQCFKLSNMLVSGDTLFIGSCGRVDLPGSSPGELYESLTQKLMKLDEQTLVFPGHNYAPGQTHTTLEQEKRYNPYLNFPSKSAFLAAMGYGG